VMRHRRDVLDVPYLIDRSTVDLSVFDRSVNAAANLKWSRLAATKSCGGSAAGASFGLSIGG